MAWSMGASMAKAVLITGCSSGIGRCVAEGLKIRGYRVFASARREADVEALDAAGFEALRLDLDDSRSIAAAVEDVLGRTGGRLYGLFNNAGYGQPGAVEDLSREALRQQLETNLLGGHELTCRVLPVMRRQGQGRILQNSSVLGLVAMPYRGAYNASKFALEGLTDTLRLELTGSGVHVSLIEPGPIESRFRANAYAAFDSHVRAETSHHRVQYEALKERLRTPGRMAPFILPPEALLKPVLHALESPRPRARYRVTLATHLLAFLRRVLSTRQLDRVLLRVSEGGRR